MNPLAETLARDVAIGGASFVVGLFVGVVACALAVYARRNYRL